MAAFPADPPNDPLYEASPVPGATSEQWDLSSDRGIGADRAWPLATGEGIVIADIDVGVQLDHPDLAGQWALNPGEAGAGREANGVDDDRNGFVDDWRGWDFYSRDNDPSTDTRNEHGTNVAGVLAAQADNGLGIAGIAPGARILPLRTADNILHQGHRLAQAIVYAADRGARAISMSLGADSFSDSLRKAVRYAHRRGVVIAVASGNEFHFHQHYPQVMDEVLAVGGVNPDTADLASKDQRLALTATRFDAHSSYADYGPHLDVVAPTQVPTTTIPSAFRMTWDGTSAATPHVAAAAALIQARAGKLGLSLGADEVMMLIRMTAADVADPARGSGPGWDLRTGWGRLDAGRAVERAKAETIPPVANIVSPSWYRPFGPATRAVQVTGYVRGRSPARWTLELGRGREPARWQAVADGGSLGSRRSPVRLAGIGADRLPAGGWTLRLRAVDARGNAGEDRAYFTTSDDPDLRPGFPRSFGTSGEASPQLADVDGDRRSDLVLALADGTVTVLDGRTMRPKRGWPRRMRASAGSRPVARRIGTVRPGFLATPAVGDIAGDRRPEVVATGLDGRIYAWVAEGRPARGFPYRAIGERPAADGTLDAAFYASPALADLDGDGKLDIVVGGADQRIHAIKGNGAPVPGWPVLARDGADGNRAKILSSPAIGDLDGDHRPDVVEGTGEAYGSTPDTSGRIHAFDATGRPLPGWPVRPSALAADSIPLAGEGVPGSPVLADIDGDGRDEVATTGAFTGVPELYRGDGTPVPGPPGARSHFQTLGTGPASRAQAPAAIGLGANAAFGRQRPNGPLRLFGGLIDLRLAAAQSLPATPTPFEHLMGGWDAAGGDWLPAFPVVMEGWQIISGPAVADVDGDDRAEVLAGGSGNVLHALAEDGTEPRGWPKDLGGWSLAVPAIGDIDGDGRQELVQVTRDGWLYVFDLPAKAVRPDWPSFRHDQRNTGNLGSR
jgi:hypothetical protein